MKVPHVSRSVVAGSMWKTVLGVGLLLLWAESSSLGGFVEDMGDCIMSEIAVSCECADCGVIKRSSLGPSRGCGSDLVGRCEQSRRPNRKEVSWVLLPAKALASGTWCNKKGAVQLFLGFVEAEVRWSESSSQKSKALAKVWLGKTHTLLDST